MSYESDLRAAALAVTNLANLIGTRFYPVRLPQDAATPAITYRQLDSQQELTLGGTVIGGEVRYELTLLATTYGYILQLKSALQELEGTDYGSLTGFVVNDGPDGYDFTDEVYYKLVEVSASI